jgi:hypothetical protein
VTTALGVLIADDDPLFMGASGYVTKDRIAQDPVRTVLAAVG